MEEVLLSRDGHLGVLAINNAPKRNILTDRGIAALERAFDELEADRAIRCVLLRGVGNEAFSAGYDLTTLSAAGEAVQSDRLHELLDRVERYPLPVVAYIRGYAIGGGCELALACDIRVGADDVRMGMPPAKLGIVYPLTGHARFVRTIGLAATKEIFFSGRIFPAPECARLGLVSVLTSCAEAEDEAFRLAREISDNAPLALSGTKRILQYLTAAEELRPHEKDKLEALFQTSLRTRDLAEGKLALQERRKAIFVGE